MPSAVLEEEPDARLPEGEEEVAPSEEAVVSVIASPALESEVDVELPEEEEDITSVGDVTAVELADESEPEEAVVSVIASPVLESEVDAGLPEAVRPEEEADPLGGREVAAGLGSELRELEGSALAADLDLGVKGFAELLY